MRRNLSVVALIAIISLTAAHVMAQTREPLSTLCDLQSNTAPGEHRTVRVKGVYLSGLESQDLMSPSCSKQSTAIEFKLKSHRLWKQLVQMSNKTNAQKHVAGDSDAVLVVFEGEFYGPPVPNPKLPAAISKNYHPGWDYNSMTKLIVHTIQSVEAAPAGSPQGADLGQEIPGHAQSLPNP